MINEIDLGLELYNAMVEDKKIEDRRDSFDNIKFFAFSTAVIVSFGLAYPYIVNSYIKVILTSMF